MMGVVTVTTRSFHWFDLHVRSSCSICSFFFLFSFVLGLLRSSFDGHSRSSNSREHHRHGYATKAEEKATVEEKAVGDGGVDATRSGHTRLDLSGEDFPMKSEAPRRRDLCKDKRLVGG